MDPAIPISLSIGFSLRIFLLLFDRQNRLRPAFLGIWEGIALYRGLTTTAAPPVYSYLPCAFRLAFDFLFTENVNTMITLIFSMVLAVSISDVVGSHHGHDSHVRRRSDVKRKPVTAASSPEVTEIREPPRMNRIRFMSHREKTDSAFPTSISPVGMQAANNETVEFGHGFVVPVDEPRTNCSSPGHNDETSPLVVNPMTPPCTPPKAVSSPYETEHIPVAMPQTSVGIVLQLEDVSVGEVPIVVDAAQDELQTPLALNLRDLPLLSLELGQSQEEPGLLLWENPPLPDDSASFIEADIPQVDDDVSELSLQTGTDLSTISANNAQAISAKAEHLRIQAWSEEAQIRRLEEELQQVVSQRKIKDAFMLRREIEAVEERVRKLHRRAARRHFRARNLSSKDGVIDVHGLFVPEAIKKVETSLQTAIWNNRKDLRVIVGRGLHSRDGRPKLRDAITKEMQRQSIPCRIQSDNPGVLILAVPS